MGSPESKGTTEHTLGFHQGEVLFRLSNTYETIPLTLVETVQNAIDASAESVFIGIDIRGRTVVVMDDGMGVSQEKFQEALRSVGKGIKKPGSLGRFGLGLISPINKCRVFNFITQPIGERNVFYWQFEGEAIRQQHEEVRIPFEQRSTLPKPPAQFAGALRKLRARWRTFVHLEEVTEQKVIGLVDLDELEGHIRTKLSQGMRQKGTTVYVELISKDGAQESRKIDPAVFKGEPLEIVEYIGPQTGHAGRVRFQLYRAPKIGGRRKGNVLVMREGDNYPISWREFWTQAMGLGWLLAVKDAFDALRSGYFEGIITVERLDLDPTRTRFVISDALSDTYTVIDRWFEDCGRDYYEEERTQRQEERYKSLGERSLVRLLERLMNDQAFAGLTRGLLGILPEHDVGSDLDKEGGPTPSEPGQAKKRRRVRATAPRDRSDRKRSGSGTRPPRDEATSFTVSFAYEILPESTRLFEFAVPTGILTFNVLHPIWVSLDETQGKHTPKNDKQIMRLQEWLAFKVLLFLSQHGVADFDHVVEAIHAEVKFYAPLFIAE